MTIPPNNGFIISALLVGLLTTALYGDSPMPSHYLELTRPEHAYLFGFIQADGTLYKDPKKPNKGKLKIELSARDVDILQKLQEVIPVKSSLTSRVRSTNFTKGELAQSYSLNVCDMGLRRELESLGVPCGRKSAKVSPPTVPYSKVDYFRGVLDGDGSLGLTSKGMPFLSFVTTGDSMAANYIDFVSNITGHTIGAHRNKRDSAYNLLLINEKATEVVRVLYYEGCLALERKKDKAAEVLGWERPLDKPKINFVKKRWTPEEDATVLSSHIEEASEKLDRTIKSVSVRKWRLTGKCT